MQSTVKDEPLFFMFLEFFLIIFFVSVKYFFIQLFDFHDTDPGFNRLTWFDELTDKFIFYFFFFLINFFCLL
jgi:hypothetical protein